MMAAVQDALYVDSDTGNGTHVMWSSFQILLKGTIGVQMACVKLLHSYLDKGMFQVASG